MVRGRISLVVAAALAAATILLHLLDFAVWDLRIDALDADSDGGIFQWVGALMVAVAALAAAASRRWLLAAILGFLFVGGRLHLSDSMPHWPLVYGPLLAIAVLLLWRRGPLGVALLALSLAIHEAGPPLLAKIGWGPASLGYAVKVAVKEASELAGWTLVASALVLACAGDDRVRQLVQQLGVLRQRREPAGAHEPDAVELLRP